MSGEGSFKQGVRRSVRAVEGPPSFDRAAAHQPVLRVVIRKRAVISAALIPNRDVTRSPTPPNRIIRIVDEIAQVTEKRIALRPVHAHKVIDEGAQEQGLTPSLFVGTDERKNRALKILPDHLLGFSSVHGHICLNKVVGGRMQCAQVLAHSLHFVRQTVVDGVQTGPEGIASHCGNTPLMVMPGSHRTFLQCAGATPDRYFEESLVEEVPRVGVPSEQMITTLYARHGIEVLTGDAGSMTVFDSNLLHASSGNISPVPRANIFVVFNSVENSLGKPFSGTAPRPEFLAFRP